MDESVREHPVQLNTKLNAERSTNKQKLKAVVIDDYRASQGKKHIICNVHSFRLQAVINPLSKKPKLTYSCPSTGTRGSKFCQMTVISSLLSYVLLSI